MTETRLDHLIHRLWIASASRADQHEAGGAIIDLRNTVRKLERKNRQLDLLCRVLVVVVLINAVFSAHRIWGLFQ